MLIEFQRTFHQVMITSLWTFLILNCLTRFVLDFHYIQMIVFMYMYVCICMYGLTLNKVKSQFHFQHPLYLECLYVILV